MRHNRGGAITELTKDAYSSKIILEKKRLRKEILTKLRSQGKDSIAEKSSIIKKKLFELEEFRKARCVVSYVSMQGEVDTHLLIDESIQMGKIVGVPVLLPAEGGKGKKELIISQITDRMKQLETGPYCISQPKPADIRPLSCKEMGIILVPALAFDKTGRRLGRGKGYYDRFLKAIPKNALTIGLCFDFQMVESVPTLAHDVPVRMVISN